MLPKTLPARDTRDATTFTTPDPARRARALRATRAVTFGGLALAACGTDPETPNSDTGTDATADASGDIGADIAPDTPLDTRPDAPLDVGPDAPHDIDADSGPACGATADDVCPDGCTQHDDIDCCLAQNGDFTWCDFSPEWGCQCAVEGPFAPPRFAA